MNITLDDLKTEWMARDRQLETQLRMNTMMLRDTLLEKHSATLGSATRGNVLPILFTIPFIAFFGWFISNVDVARLPVQVNLVAASAAQESYQDTYGRYASTMTELRTTGMVPTSGPVITIVYASETGFCMEGTQSGETYFVTQNQLPQVGSCLLQ